MDCDVDKFDEVVLAVLSLTLHERNRVWKSIDWGALNRLHSKGYISPPAGKAKSVILTEEGPENALRLCEKYFGRKTEA